MTKALLVPYKSRNPLRSQQWWWRLTVNGRIVASSGEGYSNKAEALRMGREVARGEHRSSEFDGDRLIVYRSRNVLASQRIRWRLKARNGAIIATSGEGYTLGSQASSMAHKVITGGYTVIERGW